MTIFITGGTSSIGRVLIKDMAKRGEAMRVLVRASSNRTGLDLPGVEFITGDVIDPDSVRRGMEGCDKVCHLAAIVGYNASEAEWWQVNRDGSHHVLQAAYDLRVGSVVQVSSISVLGPTRPGDIRDETSPVDTSKYVNLYQKTKRAADELAREFAAKGLPVKIVYPGFGYGCSWASSHPSMAEQTLLRMAAGKPVAIMGSGGNKICLAYYKDTVQGIYLAHQCGKPGDDYILGGANLTFPEVWDVVAQVLKKEPPRRRIPLWLVQLASSVTQVLKGKPLFSPEFFEMIALDWNYSSAKAECVLGWRPHLFDEGLAETWTEYQAGGWNAR